MNRLDWLFKLFDDHLIFRWLAITWFAVLTAVAPLAVLGLGGDVLFSLPDSSFFAGVGRLVFVAGIGAGLLVGSFVMAYRGAYGLYRENAIERRLLRLCARILRVHAEAMFLGVMVWVFPGLAAAVLTALSASSASHILPALIGGFGGVIGVVAYAFVWLFVSYLLAEALELVASMSVDLAALRQAAEEDTPSAEAE